MLKFSNIPSHGNTVLTLDITNVTNAYLSSREFDLDMRPKVVSQASLSHYGFQFLEKQCSRSTRSSLRNFAIHLPTKTLQDKTFAKRYKRIFTGIFTGIQKRLGSTRF